MVYCVDSLCRLFYSLKIHVHESLQNKISFEISHRGFTRIEYAMYVLEYTVFYLKRVVKTEMIDAHR